MPNLSIVVCGAPLAARANDLADAARSHGWGVTMLVTPSAEAWLESTPSSSFRRPEEPKPPRPDAIVVFPMTFNTGNKWALGIADSRALALLAETLGAGKPCVAIPMLNESLWGHPAWAHTMDTLSGAGVRFVDPGTGDVVPRAIPSGSGDSITAGFDPSWVLKALAAD
jgi:phosphopantothenoylcysteine synthetase/decarboxylase